MEWIPQLPPPTAPLAFEEPHYSFTVMESDPVNHIVGVVTVKGHLGLLWFSISGEELRQPRLVSSPTSCPAPSIAR